MALEFGVVVPTWGAFGDAQKIRQLIQRAEALGYASVWVGNPAAGLSDSLEQMERFAERVMPGFASGR